MTQTRQPSHLSLVAENSLPELRLETPVAPEGPMSLQDLQRFGVSLQPSAIEQVLPKIPGARSFNVPQVPGSHGQAQTLGATAGAESGMFGVAQATPPAGAATTAASAGEVLQLADPVGSTVPEPARRSVEPIVPALAIREPAIRNSMPIAAVPRELRAARVAQSGMARSERRTRLNRFSRALTQQGLETLFVEAGAGGAAVDTLLVWFSGSVLGQVRLELSFAPGGKDASGVTGLQGFVEIVDNIDPVRADDCHRLTNLLNARALLSGFFYLEQQRLICFRHSLLLPPEKLAADALVVCAVDGIARLLTDVGGAINQVARGTVSVDAVSVDAVLARPSLVDA